MFEEPTIQAIYRVGDKEFSTKEEAKAFIEKSSIRRQIAGWALDNLNGILPSEDIKKVMGTINTTWRPLYGILAKRAQAEAQNGDKKADPPALLTKEATHNVLNTHLDNVSIPTRVGTALYEAGYEYIGDIITKNAAAVRKTPRLGNKGFKQLCADIRAKGADFGMDTFGWERPDLPQVTPSELKEVFVMASQYADQNGDDDTAKYLMDLIGRVEDLVRFKVGLLEEPAPPPPAAEKKDDEQPTGEGETSPTWPEGDATEFPG